VAGVGREVVNPQTPAQSRMVVDYQGIPQTLSLRSSDARERRGGRWWPLTYNCA
jgi:hypothetical protein